MVTWYLLLGLMLFLFLCDYCMNKNKIRINMLTIFIIILLTSLSGIRGEDFPDQAGYQRFFETIPSLFDFLFYGKSFIGLEPLYQLAVSIFKIFSNNFNLFMGVQSFLLLLVAAVSFRRLNAPVNICMIFYFLVLYHTHFGQQRMGISFVLCLFATTYLVRNSFVKFVGAVLLSTGFHYVSILFLPAYWIYRLFFSKKVKRFKIEVPCEQCALESNSNVRNRGQYYLKKMTYRTLNYSSIIKVVIIGMLALAVTINFNFFGLMFEILSGSQGIVVTNIYAHKFLRSYSFITEKPNILDAWFGQAVYCVVAFFMYFFRKQWLNKYTAPLFINFCIGIVLVILVYGLPTLTDRIFRIYATTAFVVIFGFMGQQRKNAIFILPFVFTISVYIYLYKIFSETGPYHTMF